MRNVGRFTASLALAAAVAAADERRDIGARQAELRAKEAEITALRAQLEALDDAGDYALAVRLGVIEAVKATGLPPPAQRRIASAIVRESRRNGLDPLLVVAVIRTESSFDSFAVSSAGAMGLMQVMPETGRYWATKRGERLLRATNLFDAELNISLGTSYLASLIARFGSVESALVAYNAGPSAAARILRDREARKKFMSGYVRKVKAAYRRLAASTGPVNLAARP